MVEDKVPENDVTPDQETPSGVEEAIENAQASLDEVRDAVGDASTAVVDASAPDDGPLDAPEENTDLPPAASCELDLLGDVDMQVMIELGRTQMLVEDVLKLGQGSVVELDKLAGDPVDVYVNRRLVARGEVLVLNDNFCVRISEIVVDLEQQATDAVQDGVAASR